MQTLLSLKKNIDELLQKYPQFATLPLVYSSDDEGNSFKKVWNDISPAQFHNIQEWELELVGFLNEDNPEGKMDEDQMVDDICYKDVNAIVIN